MAPGRGGGRSRALRWLALVLSAILVISLAFLTGVSVVLAMISPPRVHPAPAAAVVVIAGAEDGRHDLAAELIQEGYSDNLVVSNPAGKQDEAGYALCQGEGVPAETDTWCMDPVPVTTTGEAKVFNRLARQEGWESALLVTSPTHHRRVAMIFRQCTDVRVQVADVDQIDAHELARQVLWEFGGFLKFWFTQPCWGD